MSEIAVALPIESLTPTAFEAFGEVIAAEFATRTIGINAGTAQRFHALARTDCVHAGGSTVISVFRAQPRPLPFEVRMLERHPLGSQAFVPLDPATRYVVVVATSPHSSPRAFLAQHGQGVNLARGTWHHPLIALDARSDFLVIDRDGPGENCDEVSLAQAWRLQL